MKTLKFTLDNLFLLLLIAVMSFPLLVLAEPSPQSTTAYTEAHGSIEGSLSYPSHAIPEDLQVCAETLDHKVVKCTDEHLKDPKYVYGEGFLLKVPEGSYYVYAQSDFLDQLNNAHYRGYYTEFVLCGQGPGCQSHEPIIVHVSPGQTVEGVMPADWELFE